MKIEKHVLPKKPLGSKSIIVGRLGRDYIVADNILVDCASILSEDVTILDKLVITEEDKILYICGHGNKNKQTIGDRSLSDIAYILVEAGYRGKQAVYVASCNASTMCGNNNKYSMVDTLEKELKVKLKDRGLVVSSLDVYSDCDGKSVVVEEPNRTIIHILNNETKVESLILSCQSIKQKVFNSKAIKIHFLSVGDDIKDSNSKFKKYIAEYKRRLLINETLSIEIIDTLGIVALFGGFPVACAANYLTPNISIEVAVLTTMCIILISHITSRATIKSMCGTPYGILLLSYIVRYASYIFLIIKVIV